MRTSIEFRPLLELIGLMLFGMLFSALLIALTLPEQIPFSNPKGYPGQFLYIGAVTLIFSFGVPALLWLQRRSKMAQYQEKAEKKLQLYLLGLTVFMATIFASSGIYEGVLSFFNARGWEHLTQEPENMSMVRDLLSHKDWLPLTLLVIAVIPAVVEELFFRKALFSYLHKQSATFWSPAILSSLFFAAMHQHLLSMIPIFMLGMALAYAYHITRNIWLPIALHAINNAISIVAVYWGAKDDIASSWLFTLTALLVIVFLVQRKPPTAEKTDPL